MTEQGNNTDREAHEREIPDEEVVTRFSRVINTLNPKPNGLSSDKVSEVADFWNRAVSTISDLRNSTLRDILAGEPIKTVIAYCRHADTNFPLLHLSNDRKRENISPDAMDRLIEDFGKLSPDSSKSVNPNTNRLWKLLPKVAGIQNAEIGPLVEKQLKSFKDSYNQEPNSNKA